MIKDKVTSIRINTDVFKKLEKMKITPQNLIDEGVEKYLVVKTKENVKITIKRGK